MAKVKDGKKVSPLDQRKEGDWQGKVTQQNPHSGNFTSTEMIVQAKSGRDAQNQIVKSVNPNFPIVKLVLVFLGILLIGVFVGMALGIIPMTGPSLI